MPEQVLIDNCSPTLAGIKPASLVNVKYESREQADNDIRRLNRDLFVARGLRAVPLRYSKESILLFVYRWSALERCLGNEEIRHYLEKRGYTCRSVTQCVAELAQRIRMGDGFPHEIGIFLGYPLCDVIGFTEHRDSGCKCTGYWKVYGNEADARRTFERYRQCTACYRRSWLRGATLESLTVRL